VLFYVFCVVLCIFVLFYAFLCCSMYFCVVLCIFCDVLCIFVLFYVFLCFSMYFCCCSVYFLSCSMYFVLFYVFCVVLYVFVLFYVFCVVLCIFCFASFSVLFVCICVLNYCHWVATQLQLNISYHIFYVNLKIRRSEFLAEVARKISGFCHLILVINILTSVGAYCQLRHLQKIIKFKFILPYRKFNFDLKFVPEIA